MRRLFTSLRASLFFSLLVVVYAVLRWWASSGHSPARFPDSIGYSQLKFFGTNERLWAVPLMYSLGNSDHQRVLLQILVGIIAWSYLAWVLGTITRYPRGIFLATFVVGLTPQVIRFDNSILSESLGISFAVMCVAATFQLVRHQTLTVRIVWWASLLMLAFTRPTHLVILFGACFYFLYTYLFSRKRFKKSAAITFALLSVWGVMQLRGNQAESTVNFYTVLQQRICKNENTYNWFTHHGMPDIPPVCKATGYAYSYQVKNTLGDVLQLPEGQQPLQSMVVGDIPLAKWVVNHGWSTYSQFVMSRPSEAIQLIQKHSAHSLDAVPTSFLPSEVHTIVPPVILSPWWAWMSICMIAFMCAVAPLKSRLLARRQFFLMAAASAIYVLSIITSAVEVDRHAATSSILLRVLTLTAVSIATMRSSAPRDENELVRDGATSPAA